MTADDVTLTEFLLARIAEDEVDARSVQSEWERGYISAYDSAQVPTTEAGEPDRVLAECAAKRLILLDIAKGDAMDAEEDFKTTFLGSAALLVPMHMATVYADHSDYRDEWRP